LGFILFRTGETRTKVTIKGLNGAGFLRIRDPTNLSPLGRTTGSPLKDVKLRRKEVKGTNKETGEGGEREENKSW